MAVKPCPANCQGGSVKKTCGNCMNKGCNVCNGQGWTWEDCPRCSGSGTVPK